MGLEALSLEVVVTILAVVGSVWFLNKQIAETRTELKTDIVEVRKELKTDIIEVRKELKTDIAGVRKELKADIQRVQEQADKANDFHIQIIDRLASLEGKVDCIVTREQE